GAGSGRLAACRALRRHEYAPQDSRRDGDLRRDRRAGRRKPGRRLPAHPRRRPERPAAPVLRLCRDRRRRARSLQPLRRRPDRVPHRRASERREHLAGRRLPLRARRRYPRAHPVLGSRRRAAHPLPRAPGPPHAGAGSRDRMNNSLLIVVLASGVAYGTPLLYAALGELLAERSGVLNLGVEGMMLVGAAMGFWAVQRVHASTGLSLAAAVAVAALA